MYAEAIDWFKLRQADIRYWLTEKVGIPEQFESIENRSQRFLEEAIELVQVTGLTKEQSHQLVDYVYNRPVGEFNQEVGGVHVCLAALTLRYNPEVDPIECMMNEIDRIHRPEMIQKVRDAIERKRRDGVGI